MNLIWICLFIRCVALEEMAVSGWLVGPAKVRSIKQLGSEEFDQFGVWLQFFVVRLVSTPLTYHIKCHTYGHLSPVIRVSTGHAHSTTFKLQSSHHTILWRDRLLALTNCRRSSAYAVANSETVVRKATAILTFQGHTIKNWTQL